MTSTLSWLDFSSSERRKMLEVIQLFQDHETRDELGLGTIRDGFSEMLFPGTTTLQTRARYFLIVPWLYQTYEEQRLSGQNLTDRLLHDEIRLIGALQNAGENDGVIGQRARQNLHRFPSSIYWIGLGRWGIRQYNGTPYSYYSSLTSHYRHLQSQNYRAVEEREIGIQVHPNWDPSLPKRPDDFPATASFKLRPVDAEYLRDRLQHACTGSLLAYLVGQDDPGLDVPFVWLHPRVGQLPSVLQNRLLHARNFSESMAGTSLLYNLMLAQKRQSAELVEDYTERILQWREILHLREPNLHKWHQDRFGFWNCVQEGGRISASTVHFVNRWLDLLFSSPNIPQIINHPEMRTLIEARETRLKGGRSRFRSARHLELWNGDAGTGQLDFRWRVAQRLIRDILDGLKNQGDGENAGSA